MAARTVLYSLCFSAPGFTVPRLEVPEAPGKVNAGNDRNAAALRRRSHCWNKPDLVAVQSEEENVLGRQKIEVRPVERPDALHMCFFKRRSGLFSKATELAALCGAHNAFIMFSPSGKPYSVFM
ncbi:hypothetical protein BAE44_0006171 [Dichanthelium oligosanthes]|uniref:MADS-box domain-containing protein n=1 Tax=Dichanthelium oligosanthes TaxID=888268 RepID=A0A1E5W626_9POAL|nr:hypothetical protein BAE44_0006171 [Dichanthelium oligosanthes]